MAVSQVFTTTGSQNWNWPAGVTTVVAEAVGGGGGGGTASGNPATGGGGRGGNYAAATLTKGAESLLAIVVGTGGAIASAGAASTVTQNAVLKVAALGGGGGATQATSSANGAGATVAGAGTATGTTLFTGGNGGTGNFTSGTQGSGAGGGAAGPTANGTAASVNVAGSGNTGAWGDGVTVRSGNGAAGVGNSTPGITGPTYGGGASGGKASTGADQNGAVGGQGIVVLTWTPPNQAVTGVTLAVGSVVNIPVVANTQLVTGVHRATTLALNVPTVALAAAQAVTGQTVYSTARAAFYTETVYLTNSTASAASAALSWAGVNFFQTIPNASPAVVTVIALQVRKRTGTPTDGVYLDVRAGAFNGTLVGTSNVILSNYIVDHAAPQSLTWVSFLFPAGMVWTASTTYWVGVGRTIPADDAANDYEVFASVGDAAPGNIYLYDGGLVYASNDLHYQVGTGISHTVAQPGAPQSVTGTTLTSGAILRTPTVAFPSTGLGIPLQTFTAPDGTGLSNPPWTITRGGFSTYQNTIYGTGSSAILNLAFWNANTFAADHYVEFDVIVPTGGTAAGGMVNFDASENGYGIFVNAGGGAAAASIQKLTAGGNAGLGTAFAAVSGDRCRLERVGNDLKAYVNGTLQLTVTDTSYVGVGGAGIGTYLNGQIDNWIADNMGGGPAAQSVAGAHRATTVSINTPSITLQTQGVIGATIQAPLRFQAVLFENVTGTGGWWIGYPDGIQVSQTISGHSGVITAVALAMNREAVVDFPDEEFWLEVHQGPSGPNGPLLAVSQRVPVYAIFVDPRVTDIPSVATDYEWVTFVLSAGVTLNPATTYWLELFSTRTAWGPGHWIGLQYSRDSVYPGGGAVDYNISTADPEDDLNFRLYVAGSSHTIVPIAPGGAQSVTTSHKLSTAVLNPPAVPGGTLVILLPTITRADGDLLLEDGNDLLQEDGSALLLEARVGLARTFAPSVSAPATQTISLPFAVFNRQPPYEFHDDIAFLYDGSYSTSGNPGVQGGLWFQDHITGPLTKILLQVQRVGTATDGVYLSLNSGSFNGPVVAVSNTIAFSAFTAVAIFDQEFVFPTWPVLAAGVKYYVQITFTRTGAQSGTLLLGSWSAGATNASAFNSSGSNISGVLTSTVYVAGSHTVSLELLVTGTTITSTLVMRVPTVATGPVTILGVHRPTTLQVFAPTVTSLATGAFITSGSGTFAPTVSQAVVAPHRATTIQVFAPAVAQTVVSPFRASTAQLFTPTVAAGPVGVTTATRPTTAQLFAPTVTTGPVGVTTGALASTVQLFAAAVTTGAVTVVGATLAATLVLFVPALTSVAPGGVGGGTVAATSAVYAPSLVGGLVTILPPPIASGSGLFPPSLLVGQSVTTATRPSTLIMQGPTVSVIVLGQRQQMVMIL